ncbi:unnamed protein product [Chrysoparadoxa australica]
MRLMSSLDEEVGITEEVAEYKLYIGNLGFDTSSADLKSAFEAYGEVTECQVIVNRQTGESRGFGFVSFSSQEAADSAIASMNGAEMDGRTLRVDFSRPGGARASSEESDACKVYIGNLGWDTTTDDLRDAFGQYGTLNDIIVITDRENGQSRGFGFATYSSPQEAETAIAEMNGRELDGRSLNVNISQPRTQRRDSFEVDANDTKLYVGNLGWDTTTDDLRNAFSSYGNLVDCVVISDRETGQSRGFGFCTYETGGEAQDAIAQMDGVDLDGRQIKVNLSRPRAPRRDSYESNSGYGDDLW